MELILVTSLVLLSPALLAGSLVFPVYWILQYRILRRTGSWDLERELHGRWLRFLNRTILLAYVLCAGGILLPSVFPTVHAFLVGGWMLWIAAPLLLDLLIVMTISPDEAVGRWRAEQRVRRPWL
jgi:hypothetical protein